MASNSSPRVIADKCPQCGADLPGGGGERIVCAYCGSSLIRQRAPAPRAAEDQAAGPEAAEPEFAGSWGLRLKKVSYVDQQGIGCEAFRMLIPADWQFEGGVQWPMNNPGMPGVIAFRAYNPQGVEAFEAFPNIPFYWTNNPMVTASFPMGSMYYGNEVRPPMPALQVLQQIVIPRYRRQGVQFVAQEPLPGLVQQMRATSPVAPTGVTSAEGARVRIRHRYNNQDVEEDVFGIVEVSHQPAPMFMGENIFWMASYLFSFRALAGQLDSLSDMFMAIVRSYRMSAQWYTRYMMLSQYMVQNQVFQLHVSQIKQVLAQMGGFMGDMMMDAFNQQQQTLDQLSDQFSQAVRGVDAYHDPTDGTDIELPGGYVHAWSNGGGEYILTNDANFDPGAGSNVSWTAMERK
jgi:hypothetical protein